ncbi:RHS repeat-associated core domain-containing protein [Undibacterium sp. TJN25]|uniref:RHS repeat-associated core domain-containing protein n=1 Tax=Undibacterium sp. TJN25 TaxID=3413056 RepID=UPI003BF05CC0
MSYSCSASGTGYAGSASVAVSGSSGGVASSGWVSYPSTCIWTATGTGGTRTYTETLTTVAAAPTETVTYFHTDGLGSPIARTNSTGGLISKTRYEPYGMTVSGTATPDIGFTGHVSDIDTGLTYMQQRYYDPIAGRMMSMDPVITDANSGSGFNRYAYADNSPYKYSDPDGRQAAMAFCGGGPVGCAVGAGLTIATAYYGAKAVNQTQRLLQSRSEPKKSDTAEAPKGGDTKSGEDKGSEKGVLPKPPTGPGSVPKDERDPQRFFDQDAREQKRADQGNKCANGCGATIDGSNSAGHHVNRHADGGRTVPENHAEVCVDCHGNLHRK